MMGIRLMLNFNNPYLATGLGDFWRRWHISLSTWFRDYVYIPLGGNRHGELRTYVNMVLTMLISGLWHGAMWTFVLWGAIHAVGRVLTRALEQTAFYRDRVPRLAKQVLTFSIVMLAWVFFRAESVQRRLVDPGADVHQRPGRSGLPAAAGRARVVDLALPVPLRIAFATARPGRTGAGGAGRRHAGVHGGRGNFRQPRVYLLPLLKRIRTGDPRCPNPKCRLPQTIALPRTTFGFPRENGC